MLWWHTVYASDINASPDIISCIIIPCLHEMRLLMVGFRITIYIDIFGPEIVCICNINTSTTLLIKTIIN